MRSRTILFIHGMYMTPLCWEHWEEYFQAQGYRCHAPGWPGRKETAENLRRKHPDMALGQLRLSDVIEGYELAARCLDETPIVVGHSMGGLIAQLLLQRGLAAAAVAIHSAPPLGVFSTRWSFLRANWPHITPFHIPGSPAALTFPQFQYAFANGLPLTQQLDAYDRLVVPESRQIPFDALFTRIKFGKPHEPLLFITGGADRLTPASLNRSNCNRYRHAGSITAIREFTGRTHLTLRQKGWEEVAASVDHWLRAVDVS